MVSRLEYPGLMELIFEIRDAEEGGFHARAVGYGIFTEAEDWDGLRANVLEAVSLHFEDAHGAWPETEDAAFEVRACPGCWMSGMQRVLVRGGWGC